MLRLTAFIWTPWAAMICGAGLAADSAPASRPASASSRTASAPLEIQLSPAKDAAFKFGQVTTANLTIKNVSSRAVVVLDFLPLNNLEDSISLSGPIAGNREVVHEGFLLPGQQVAVEVSYRPLFDTERFNIDYFAADGDFDGTAASFAPLSPRIQMLGRDGRFLPEPAYGRFDLTAWQAICRMTKQPISPPGPYASTRGVLLGEIKDLPMKKLGLEVPISLTAPAGGAQKALDAASAAAKHTGDFPPRLAYSQALGGYVVYLGGRCYLVKDPSGTTTPGPAPTAVEIPVLPPQLLKDVDSGERVFLKVGQRQEDDPEAKPLWLLWGKLPLVYGDGTKLKGEFVLVHKYLPEVVAQLGPHNAQVWIVDYYYHSRYYELLLPGGLLPASQPGARQ